MAGVGPLFSGLGQVSGSIGDGLESVVDDFGHFCKELLADLPFLECKWVL